MADVRNDVHHKVTSTIVKTASAVSIETLHVGGMVRNRRLARAMSDAGLGGYLHKLRYKCLWKGCWLVEVGCFYPFSKTCSGCGAIKDVRSQSEREYVCARCGLVLDRDLYAAINLQSVAASLADT